MKIARAIWTCSGCDEETHTIAVEGNSDDWVPPPPGWLMRVSANGSPSLRFACSEQCIKRIEKKESVS